MTPNEYQRLAMTTLNPSLEKKDIRDLWYLAETATALDVSLEEVLQGNIKKLKKRYPEGLFRFNEDGIFTFISLFSGAAGGLYRRDFCRGK